MARYPKGNDWMDLKQQDAAVKELEHAIEDIKTGRVKWFALSLRFINGATIAIHSEHAPLRPKGLGA